MILSPILDVILTIGTYTVPNVTSVVTLIADTEVCVISTPNDLTKDLSVFLDNPTL